MSDTNNTQEYEPFGPEWVKEVKRLPKDFLIEQWKQSRLEIQKMKEAATPSPVGKDLEEMAKEKYPINPNEETASVMSTNDRNYERQIGFKDGYASSQKPCDAMGHYGGDPLPDRICEKCGKKFSDRGQSYPRWVKASERLGEFADSDIPEWKFWHPSFCKVNGEPVSSPFFRKDTEKNTVTFVYKGRHGFDRDLTVSDFRHIEWLEETPIEQKAAPKDGSH